MQVTFTGTGGAGGVPRYGCECRACSQARLQKTLQRKPCSALIETAKTRLLLDAGLMDIHERFPANSLDSIVLTHFHPDHVQGLFHIRWGKGAPISVYCPPDPGGCADLYKNAGILDFQSVEPFNAFKVGDLTITPLPLIHSKLTFGYAIQSVAGNRFAYLTDTIGLPEETMQFLMKWKPFSLALDCSYSPRSHMLGNHNDYNLAMSIIDQVMPKKAWLTHLSHEVDLWRLEANVKLPENLAWAADDLTVQIGII